MCRNPKPRPRYRLRNWRDYNAALVRRGSLTFWCDEAALAGWVERGRTGRRGRPRTYSDAAIICMLTLQAVFHLPLRATEGFVRSLLTLLGHDVAAGADGVNAGAAPLPVAHYSTLSRRAATLTVPLHGRSLAELPGPVHLVVDTTGLKVYGEGEWKVRQHGWATRRTWLKVHLAVDAATHEIRVVGVSSPNVGDGEMLPDLLAAEPAPLAQVTGDGSYDEWRCYDAVAARPEHPRAVFPPPRARRPGQRLRARSAWRHHRREASGRPWTRALPTGYRLRIRQHGNATRPPLDRDEHVRCIRRVGRRRWKQEVGYHARSLAETAVFRLKTLFGDRLRARRFATQGTAVAIRADALNRMRTLGMPETVCETGRSAPP